MNWVLLPKFLELTGYTEDAVRCKMRGTWRQGEIWHKAGGRILLSLAGYAKWVEKEGALTAALETPGTER